MNIESLILVAILVVSVLIIISVILQPSQRTGLMGDATDVERRDKRGFELFLFRLTIFLMLLFFALAIAYATLTATTPVETTPETAATLLMNL